ncbi:sensor histidine kinase [Mediterraneibacter gnavus]|uniref:sensor histidine kinase n=1 Tax=Mediterraneibacter gnavus TaxID=33038 RepID=UPI0032BFF9D4
MSTTQLLIFLFERIDNISQFIAGFYFLRCLDCCLERRKGKLLFFITWIVCSAIASFVIFPQDATNITGIFLLFLLLNLVLYHGKWIIKLSMILILLPISAALNLLVMDIGGYLFFLYFTEQDALENTIFSTLFYSIAVIFWIVFYRLFHKNLTEIRNTFTTRAWYMISIICAASFVGIFTCVYFSPDTTWYIWPCAFACIITNIGSIRLAAYLADGIHADLERKNLQLQKNYYEELEQNQKQIRKFRHDMNNHLSVVGYLLQKGELQKARDYFDKISVYMQTANRKFCENSVVNAVLNAKYNLMTDAKIDGFFHISIDKLLFIDDVSLCTLFANTLDNAIEACQKIEAPDRRKLELKCRYTENGYFSLELINAKINEIVVQKNQYISDKEDKSAHGIGISSIRDIVEKYEGTLDISYDDTSFKVVILIGG